MSAAQTEVAKKKVSRDASSAASLAIVQAELIDLVKSIKDVSVLDAILQQLKRDRHEKKSPPSKRLCRRKSNDDHDDHDDPSTSPLYGETLCSIVGWLGPKDVLSCVQVSKQWKKDIDICEEDNDDIDRDYLMPLQGQKQNQRQMLLWKQVATNHSPSLVQAIEKRCTDVSRGEQSYSSSSSSSVASSSPSSDCMATTKLNFKSIVKGLVCEESLFQKINDNRNINPKLKLEDLIMFVEARNKNTGKFLGSWHRSLSDFRCLANEKLDLISSNDEMERKTLLPPFLDDENYEDYYFTVNPYDDTPINVFKKYISFTARIFRCDTGESFCFGFYDRHKWIRDAGRNGTVESVELQPDINTEAGQHAIMMLLQNSAALFFQMQLIYEIDVVDLTDDLEQGRIHDNQSWREIRHQFNKLSFYFRFNDEYLVVDDLLVFLDGLAWKK